MIKKYKIQLIISSIIILLPIVFGLCVWNLLPDQIATHFDINGNPDAFWSKPCAVFIMPLALLLLQWLCVFASLKLDPKNKNLETKMFGLVLWICPLIGLALAFITYGIALGLNLEIGTYMCLLLGTIFVLLGNYMPKCKQSYTLGIKLPWTLHDEENWDKTHRFAGVLWVICGLLMLGLAFLASFWILIAIVLMSVIVPSIFSYCFYRQKAKREQSEDE